MTGKKPMRKAKEAAIISLKELANSERKRVHRVPKNIGDYGLKECVVVLERLPPEVLLPANNADLPSNMQPGELNGLTGAVPKKLKAASAATNAKKSSKRNQNVAGVKETDKTANLNRIVRKVSKIQLNGDENTTKPGTKATATSGPDANENVGSIIATKTRKRVLLQDFVSKFSILFHFSTLNFIFRLSISFTISLLQINPFRNGLTHDDIDENGAHGEEFDALPVKIKTEKVCIESLQLCSIIANMTFRI